MTPFPGSPHSAEEADFSGTISVLPAASAGAGWLGAAARAAAALSAALGLAVMIGWHADVRPLIQVFPNLVPMQYNTALGFLLGGTALQLAAHRRTRHAVPLAAILVVIGMATLYQYAAAVDLGIDRLIVEPQVTVKSSYSGRMAPTTAGCFAMAGVAIAALHRRRAAVAGILGSMIAALGSSTLIAYVLGGEIPLGWRLPTNMALHTTAGFIVLGTGHVALAWREAVARAVRAPRWLALCFSLFLATLAFGLAGALENVEPRELRPATLVAGLSMSLLVGLLIDRARAARQRELKFRTIMEYAPHARIAVDAAGTVVLMNAKAEKIFGYPRDEVIGRCVDVLVPDRFRDLHPGHRQAYLRAPEARGLGGGRTLYGRRRDGREFPADVTLSPVWGDEGLLVIAAVIDISERVKLESELKALNWHLEEEVAQRTAALAAHARELERANVELLRSNADLQQFAYVASHDLQEPLRQVASFTQLLARRYRGRLDGDADEFIGYVVDGAQRMQRLIQALLSFSRIGTRRIHLAATDCDEVLDRVLKDLEITIGEAGAVITRDPLPTVLADGGQLGLVFQNLITNAIKFRAQTRRPEVHVGAEVDDGGWTFSVRDNGVGIAPEHFERIFVIFQRLHNANEYPGTGIGLAICKRVIDRHDGRVWVESRPGGGSTFCFTLPGGRLPADETAVSTRGIELT